MGRSYVFSNSNNTEIGQRKKTVSKKFAIGPNAIKFISLAIIAILGVVYLSQSTAGASRSIKIQQIETTKSELTLEQERLEAEQTRLQSLKEIDNGIAKQPMAQVGSVEHVGN